MSYRWSQEGPAFDFGNPFGLENRFVLARCVLLTLLAVTVLWLVLTGGDATQGSASMLKVGPERGSNTPHVLAALLGLALALAELLRWLRARKPLLLQPGQPASLTTEVRRESVGAAPGKPWLLQAMQQGRAAPLALQGPYQRLLLALSRGMAAAPQTLHAELQVRIANLLLGAGLALLVLASWRLLAPPGAAELAAVFNVLLGALVVGRGLLYPDRTAPGPLALAGVLVLALLGDAAAFWLAPAVPQTRHLLGLGLPQAALALLASGLLFDAVTLLAGRAQARGNARPRAGGLAASEASVQMNADPAQLLQEIDRELLRRWTDGIPNRRHAWQPPVIDHKLSAGSFTATVLEESQPLLAPAGAQPQGWQRLLTPRLLWLLLLDGLGLLWTAVGSVLWLRAAWVQSQALEVSWPQALVGSALVLAGGYALRAGHLLWSRTEATSALIWLDFKGSFRATPANPAPTGAARGGAGASIETLALRACAVQAQTVFYAAAAHAIGSRTLLRLDNDAASASAWAQHLHSLARSVTPPASSTAAAPPKGADAAGRSRPEPPAPPPKPPPRFCSACGTPLLAGARFCQHCGNVL